MTLRPGSVIDLVVIGGGPAGLATALHARRRGLDVAVIEPRDAPIDKACGEGLMPGAVAALGELGVHPLGVPFHGIRYLATDLSVAGRFIRGAGLGVRRTELHRALSTAADAAGVVRVRGRVGDLRHGADHVTVDDWRARWVVGADGLHSRTRKLAGIRSVPGPPHRVRYGMRRHYAVAPWADLVEVYWSSDTEAYVTPVAADCIGVALLTSRRPVDRSAVLMAEQARYDALMEGFPALLDRLRGATTASHTRGAGPLRQRVSRRVAGRVLLVGDAAGYVDALTGEGIGLALSCAQAAVDCLVRNRPEEYERRWRSITREHRLLTIALLGAAQHPALRRRLVPIAARLPWLFTYAVNRLAS